MQYRPLGRTGMQASIIGLGMEHLDRRPYEVADEVISAAIDHGITIADCFMPGDEVRRNIGRALKGRRDKLILQGMVCSVDLNEQYDISRDLATCETYFETLLRALQTDYIDCGMLFFMDTQEALDQVIGNGIYDYMLDLKQQGKIRSIGASSHNPLIARQMVERGMLETLLFSINPAYDRSPDSNATLDTLGVLQNEHLKGVDPARAALYLECERRGVGITVMKSLGAGKLLSAQHTPFQQPLTVGQCIHYALSRPAVASVMVGCSSAKEVEEACRYLTMTDEERDYSAIIEGGGATLQGACVYCGHCQPCPVNIDIASTHRYLDMALLDESSIPPSVRQHYGSMAAHGSDCIQCGSCEERCPFGVQVINNMERAAQVFGQ